VQCDGQLEDFGSQALHHGCKFVETSVDIFIIFNVDNY
jgi:hypothetical protein